MTMSPLRFLALLAIATWCGHAARGQQYAPQQYAPQQYQTAPYAAPAPAMLPPQYQGGAPGGVVPAAYFQGSPMQGGIVQGGMMQGGGMPMQGMTYEQGAASGGQTSYSGYGSEGGYAGGNYNGDYGDRVGGYLEDFGNPEGNQHPCYTEGHCYVYTRAEVFFLDRDIRSNKRFTSQRVNGPTVLQTRDLEFEFEPGIRAVVGVPLSDCLALEGSYFGLQNWSDTATATDPQGNLFSIYSQFGTGQGFVINGRQIFDFTEGSTSQSISYNSEIHNMELNLMDRYCLKNPKQELWLFAGARYIMLDENFSFSTEAQTMDPVLGIRTSLSTVDTVNDMVGFQIGGVLNHFISKRVRASVDGKACAMANFSEVRTEVGTNLFPLGGEFMRDETVAFSAEMGATLTWDATCWLSFTGGYRAVFIDGATLAARNFNEVLPGNGLRVPFHDTEGSILMQGATAGGEIRW